MTEEAVRNKYSTPRVKFGPVSVTGRLGLAFDQDMLAPTGVDSLDYGGVFEFAAISTEDGSTVLDRTSRERKAARRAGGKGKEPRALAAEEEDASEWAVGEDRPALAERI